MVELARLIALHTREWGTVGWEGCMAGWAEWVEWEDMARCMEVACTVGWEGCQEIPMIRIA
jgi:hypothetical protein